MASIRIVALAACLVAPAVIAYLPEECLGDQCVTDDEEAAHFVQKNAQKTSSLEAAEKEEKKSVTDAAAAWTKATGCSGILCNGNCPITSNPTKDGGCCNSGYIGTGHQSCVKISSSNILKYSCGLSPAEAAGAPDCKNDASFFSNKDKVEKCTLGGQTCTYTKYGWWTRKINLAGGNKADKLQCTCEDVPTYRRNDDGPWALGLIEADASGNASLVQVETDARDKIMQVQTDVLDKIQRSDDSLKWQPQGCTGLLCMGNCAITMVETNDGGCCNAGSIGTGHKSCVRITSASLLKYACKASGAPSCKNDASFFSNKDKVDKCSVGGFECTETKYGWWTRKLNLGGGNKQDKLECDCGDVPTYRRAQDGPWVVNR